MITALLRTEGRSCLAVDTEMIKCWGEHLACVSLKKFVAWQITLETEVTFKPILRYSMEVWFSKEEEIGCAWTASCLPFLSKPQPNKPPLNQCFCSYINLCFYVSSGERKTTVSCTKIMNKNISFVDNKKCKYLTKPKPQIRKCNEQPCQIRWLWIT